MNKKNPASSPASRLGEERPGQQLYKGKRKKMNRTQLEQYFSAINCVSSDDTIGVNRYTSI